jgi:hypothetical protein
MLTPVRLRACELRFDARAATRRPVGQIRASAQEYARLALAHAGPMLAVLRPEEIAASTDATPLEVDPDSGRELDRPMLYPVLVLKEPTAAIPRGAATGRAQCSCS